MIKEIEIEKISGHPNNPRKDLGNLEELAATIKANGILQNLTVVKGEKEDAYVVVIGHRRLGAARLAGLKTVPCTVAEMDEKTQISTMLLENIQRTDLTILEQANGFQLMLDLGDTIDNIAGKTGFSKTTIHRRTRLLDLEKDGFKAAVERGATLMDFAELDKITDPARKNKVMDTIGTPNFKYNLNAAIDQEKMDIAKANLIEELETFATKIEDTENLNFISSFWYPWNYKVEKPEDTEKKEYFFKIELNSIRFYGEITAKMEEIVNKEQEEAAEKSTKLNSIRENLDEIATRSFRLRKEFVKNFPASAAKKNCRKIMEFCIRSMLENEFPYFDEDMFLEMIDIELEENEEFSFDIISERFGFAPERIWLIAVYCNISDRNNLKYSSYNCKYIGNSKLDKIYDFLTDLGYQASDEEIYMANGSHKLYVLDEKE